MAGRSELRDFIDVIYLHERHLALDALVWAAVGKDGGFTPESAINWMRRHAVFRPEDAAAILTVQPISLPALKEQWLRASESALEQIRRLPPEEVGCLYLDSAGQPVSPDPESSEFAKLTRHYGSVKGAWPRIV